MADERDLELLDDYLTNRMSEQDRSAFEQKLTADPDLQHEYALQKRLIQGIKDSRIAELKSMLNNVPVPAGTTGNTITSKIILGTVVSLMIAAVAYYYLREDRAHVQDRKAQEQQMPGNDIISPDENTDATVNKPDSQTSQRQTVEADKNQTSAGTEQSKPSLAKKPDPLSPPTETKEGPVLDVFTPEKEDNNSPENNLDNKQPALTPGTSSLVVETDRNNRRYTFDYQFREGKLFLYGPFEKNLYEIMEFFTDEKRTVFLYYKDHYYLLDEADSQIKPLTPITDQALIKKLTHYRSSK